MLRRFFSCCTRPQIAWNDTIPFVPPVNKGQVIKVYDGDTITIASKLPYRKSPLYRFRVRLSRIDAPEMKTSDRNEAALALISRDILRERVMGRRVTLKNVKTEKYGRVLADVYCDGCCINDWMLSQRLAVSYDGGKKEKINWKFFLAERRNVSCRR